jgi:hypothetical protein
LIVKLRKCKLRLNKMDWKRCNVCIQEPMLKFDPQLVHK